MNRHELVAAIYRTSHLTGEFYLRSGAVSSHYFDKYRFEGDPRLLAAVVDALKDLIPIDTEVLPALELGGVPLVTMLSQVTGLPAIFVRKAPKFHGTQRLAEGGEIANRRLLVVEDVAGRAITMAQLAARLKPYAGRPVIDRINLAGDSLSTFATDQTCRRSSRALVFRTVNRCSLPCASNSASRSRPAVPGSTASSSLTPNAPRRTERSAQPSRSASR